MPGQLTEDVACNLCDSRDSTLLYESTLRTDTPSIDDFRCTSAAYGVHPPIVRCRRCGLVYANPRWDSKVVSDNYGAVEDHVYVEEQEGRILTFSAHLRPFEALVANHTQTRRILDVGCCIGVMVDLAREHGWEAWGVEPSRWAAEHARAKGLRVITGTLDSEEIPRAYFDVVTMWDVIEHLTDPLAVLKTANRTMKVGGVIAVHTINIESLLARIMGAKWPWLMEMHLYYLSPRTLSQMLTKAGFEVIDSRTQGRYLRLGYLLTRVRAISAIAADILERAAERWSLREKPIPVNFGDLFTTHARKVTEPADH